MYSGKIAVPPGGGGIRKIYYFKLFFLFVFIPIFHEISKLQRLIFDVGTYKCVQLYRSTSILHCVKTWPEVHCAFSSGSLDLSIPVHARLTLKFAAASVK
jgi:hypothetical protein